MPTGIRQLSPPRALAFGNSHRHEHWHSASLTATSTGIRQLSPPRALAFGNSHRHEHWHSAILTATSTGIRHLSPPRALAFGNSHRHEHWHSATLTATSTGIRQLSPQRALAFGNSHRHEHWHSATLTATSTGIRQLSPQRALAFGNSHRNEHWHSATLTATSTGIRQLSPPRALAFGNSHRNEHWHSATLTATSTDNRNHHSGYQERMQDDDDKNFEEKFKEWPSFFNLEFTSKQTDKDIKDNIRTLVRKLESGEVECTKERVKINNILSFLNWKQNKKNEAKRYLKSVVSDDKQNINARCTQIWMDWTSGRKAAANDALEKLCEEDESSDEFKQQRNRAKAETAYYCSVSGPTHFHHSLHIYDDVILNSKGDETDVWRFDRAIVLRKICNDENITQSKEYRELKYEHCMKTAAHDLHALTSSSIGKRKIAVCWASLGELLAIFDRRKRPSINQSDIFPEELAETKIETLLENALSENNNDTHVLKVCGKIFRYINKLDRAEDCLRKSLELRKTSYAYHHLALVLIEKIKLQGKEQEKSNVATRRRYQIFEKDKSLAPEIITYLKEAIKMNRNEWASFELGMLYLSLGQPDKAFHKFVDTLKVREEPSLLMEINCYEHQGFCCLDMAKTANNAVDAHHHEEDAKCCFLKAIRLAACNASQLIHWKEECIAFPTLKEMFEAKERDVNTLRDLSKLSRLLGEHGEVLSFYDEIVKMDPEQANDSLFIRGKIQTYLDAKLYEDAATFLDLMSCTKREQLIPLKLYSDVYLKLAFCCIENNRPTKEFHKRLRQAFSASKKTDDGKYNFKFDIFLLHDKGTVRDGLKMKFLQEFGKYLVPSDNSASSLLITMNSETVQPGTYTRPQQIEQMENSAYIIVVMDEDDIQSPNFEYYLQIAQEIHHDSSNRTTLFIILLNDLICPREMIVYPKMAFKKNVFHDQDTDLNFVQWLKECFQEILVGTST